jgi:hypothetical protein
MGQATPPWVAPVLTVRVRVWLPASQVTEHSDQASQLETTQLPGQGERLQTRD